MDGESRGKRKVTVNDRLVYRVIYLPPQKKAMQKLKLYLRQTAKENIGCYTQMVGCPKSSSQTNST